MEGLEALKQNKYLVIIPDNNMLKYNHNEEIIKKELKALEIIIKYVGASPISFFIRQGNANKEEIKLVEEVLHEKDHL